MFFSKTNMALRIDVKSNNANDYKKKIFIYFRDIQNNSLFI